MATTQEDITSVNDSTIDLIVRMQDRIVDAQKEFASTVAELVPDIPSVVPKVDRPDVADPKSLVEQSFDFQARLLEANRNFSLGLIDAWAQAVPKQTQKAKATTKK